MIAPHKDFSITYHCYDEKDKIELLLQNLFENETGLSCYTSGSTGKPKEIHHSTSSLLVSAKKTISYFELEEQNKAALCLSVDHIAGIMMVVRAVIAGMHLHVYSVKKKVLDEVEEDLDFISLVPLQLEYAMNNSDCIQKIKGIKNILIGGAPLSPILNKRMEQDQIRAFHSYGMTETLTHVALKKAGVEGNDHYTALDGISFGVNKEALTITYPEVLNAPLITKDRIRLIDSTKFVWLGRLDHVINTGGVKVSPELVEQKLSDALNTPFIISSIYDESLGEKVCLIVENKALHFEPLSKNKLQLFLHQYEVPKVYSTVKEFVRTPNGKIHRSKTKQLASDHGWKELL